MKRTACLLSLSLFALAHIGDAQTLVPLAGAFEVGPEAITVDSIGLMSTPVTRAEGRVVLSIPPGATISWARLVTFIRFRRDIVAGISALPGYVELEGARVISATSPGMTFVPPLTAARCVADGTRASVCFTSVHVDVTNAVRTALTAPRGFQVMLRVAEVGDSDLLGVGVGDSFSWQGHALIVRYRHPSMARRRFVGAWVGASDETLESLLYPVAVPPVARCPPGSTIERDERVAVSLSVASEETTCSESNVIELRGVSSFAFAGIGGADDGAPGPIAPSLCSSAGRTSDFRALITTGSFGGADGALVLPGSAELMGRPIGLDGDDLAPGMNGSRRNDELLTIEVLPTQVRLTDGRNGASSPLKSLGLVVLQYPVDGDSDDDGHPDLVEGICRAVDTDSDGREDWEDRDSDNDCIPDSRETPEGRTIPAEPTVADARCSAPAPFCDLNTGACIQCPLDCRADPRGSRCARGERTEFVCYCSDDTDCPAGGRCGDDKQCSPLMDASVDGAADDGFSDGATTDGVTSDGTVNEVSLQDGGSSGSSNATRAPTFSGGACACAVLASPAARRTMPSMFFVALALVSLRRRRVRSGLSEEETR